MDVDPVARKLYYTEHQGNTVSRANYDGSLVELIYQGRFNQDFPADVAVDHAAGLVFITIQSVPTLLNGSLVRCPVAFVRACACVCECVQWASGVVWCAAVWCVSPSTGLDQPEARAWVIACRPRVAMPHCRAPVVLPCCPPPLPPTLHPPPLPRPS